MAETLVGYKKHIKFMINLDMVGRVNPSTNSLTIGGYGTSPDWPGVFSHNTNKDLIIKFDSSGTGPSDHTSFYRKNIPVLFYFSGLHQDYHKPSDDSDKINYVGMINIFKNVINVIGISRYYPINFTKTREVQTSTSARFSVSLGIMPDYSYNDGGVRIDGTSDGKIAQTIGLKSGDIIIRIGNHQINSVEAYMQVLSKFKKGDITEVEVKRGSDSIVKVFTF
jgi:C-terminal processing protease CtpA/Prc